MLFLYEEDRFGINENEFINIPQFMAIKKYFDETYFTHYDFLNLNRKEFLKLLNIKRAIMQPAMKKHMTSLQFFFNIGYLSYNLFDFRFAKIAFRKALNESEDDF
ncbi:MAG: hypothetical protein MJA31_01885, partial [Clostridia bacterium]|nr:hypothetical protein [Clostridia bacterium]